jgi:hypothetical protein
MMHTNTKKAQFQSIEDWEPCFIVGRTRSGLTILLRILSDYTPVFGCRDQGMLLRFKDLLGNYGDLQVRSNMLRLIQDILDSYEYKYLLKGPDIEADELYNRLPEMTYAALINEVYKSKAETHGKVNWIEKTPYYALRIPDLLELFPKARIIHMSRDGRDVALSLFKSKHGPKNGYMAARLWKKTLLAARHARTLVGPSDFHELRYEDLLSDPVGTFSNLLEFFGMDQSLVEPWRKDADSVLMRDNAGKWKKQLSSRDVQLFEREAGDILELYGYEVVTPSNLRTPVSGVEATVLRIQSFIKQALTGSGEYYRRAITKRIQAAQIRLRSLTQI